MKAAQLKMLAFLDERIELAKSELEQVFQELTDEMDSHSDKWKEGEKGEALQEKLDALEEAIGNLESALEGIRGVSE